MTPDPSPLAALDLRDIHAPAPPSWWPPAPGWWLLGALLLALLAWLGYLGWRWWRRQRLRARVLRELAALPVADDCQALIVGVSALLKRVALRRYPRAQVAELTGRAWLEFLDRTGGHGQFGAGAGQVLEHGPYAPGPQCDPPALRALARAWLIRNL
jgi:hypothetical protein